VDEMGQASLGPDEKGLLGARRAMRIVFPARSKSEIRHRAAPLMVPSATGSRPCRPTG
jgi:hypothetical protein